VCLISTSKVMSSTLSKRSQDADEPKNAKPIKRADLNIMLKIFIVNGVFVVVILYGIRLVGKR